MKSFASDNYAAVCPEVMAAIQPANVGYAPSYGNDIYTSQALALLQEFFFRIFTVHLRNP